MNFEMSDEEYEHSEGTPFGEGKSSALNFAARAGNVEAAEILLSHGADVNHVGIDKSTPLHDAASNGQLEMVKYLTENGANINAEGLYGKTPLDVVGKNAEDSTKITHWLKNHGAMYKKQLVK